MESVHLAGLYKVWKIFSLVDTVCKTYVSVLVTNTRAPDFTRAILSQPRGCLQLHQTAYMSVQAEVWHQQDILQVLGAKTIIEREAIRSAPIAPVHAIAERYPSSFF